MAAVTTLTLSCLVYSTHPYSFIALLSSIKFFFFLSFLVLPKKKIYGDEIT